VTLRTDSELLREYVATGAEAAFALLVERHIGLVYSAALRIVVDQHLAEDVAQTTFAALGRQAREAMTHPVLPAWLHRTASNHAAKLVRGEMRRRAREQEAHAMDPHTTETEADWKQIAPLLDSAVNQLPERDREVIVMRFFGAKSAREIGEALRVSEEAAQKRVTRALERLRGIFAREGVTLSAAALAALFVSNATAAVPQGLALSVTTGALAGSSAAAVAGFSTSTVNLILMSKLKFSAVGALVIAAALVAPMILRKQQKASAPEPTVAMAKTAPAPAAAPPMNPEEERARFAAEVAQNVAMMKQVGLQLRLSMRDNPSGNINAEQVLEAVGAGASGRKPVELLVPSVGELRQIMSRTPETIIARTVEPIRTPEGKWLRVYTLADGSAHERVMDDPGQTFAGRWELVE
jgi:RNA polymerase sigma factor (sigma-70 family)